MTFCLVIFVKFLISYKQVYADCKIQFCPFDTHSYYITTSMKNYVETYREVKLISEIHVTVC